VDKFSQTADVMANAPVKDAAGRLHLRQCKPKEHYQGYVSLNKRNIPTTFEVESMLRYRLSLYRIAQGRD
jgi:hypothetical protein